MQSHKVIVLAIVMMSVMGFSLAISTSSGFNIAGGSTVSSSSTTPVVPQTSLNQSNLQSSPLHGNVTNINANLTGMNSTYKNTEKISSNLFPLNRNVASEYSMVATGSSLVVSPNLISSPAPMGIGDIGVMTNKSGVLTAYSLNTSSLEGSITLNSMSALYPLNSEPGNVTFQLNGILTNVTLFGNYNYTYWIQNVARFSTTSQTICFENNIWNFTGPKSVMTGNSINSSSGSSIISSGAYIGFGPSFQLKYPFTLDLTVSSGILNGQSAVWFNYSIPTLNLVGNYDTVLFNSTLHAKKSFVMPSPEYSISGSKVLPNSALYDAEFIIGGPGGGSNTNIMQLNGSMSLDFKNKTSKTMQPVKSAYNFGMDTGESAVGVSTYWTSSMTEFLTAGPSLPAPMWGIASSFHSGHLKISGQVNVPNAFLFMNLGTITNNLTSTFVPLTTNGKFSFDISPGNYSAQVLFNGFAPLYNVNFSGKSGGVRKETLNLVASSNSLYSTYTPLYLFTNSELKAASSSGNGNSSDPYYISFTNVFNTGVFFTVNDYNFPVFMNLFITNTTSNLNVESCCLSSNNAVFNGVSQLLCIYLPDVIYKDSNAGINGLELFSMPEPYPDSLGFFYAYLTVMDSKNVNVLNLCVYQSPNYLEAVNSVNLVIQDSDICFSGAAIFCNSSTILPHDCFYDTQCLVFIKGSMNSIATVFDGSGTSLLYMCFTNVNMYDTQILYTKTFIHSIDLHVISGHIVYSPTDISNSTTTFNTTQICTDRYFYPFVESNSTSTFTCDSVINSCVVEKNSNESFVNSCLYYTNLVGYNNGTMSLTDSCGSILCVVLFGDSTLNIAGMENTNNFYVDSCGPNTVNVINSDIFGGHFLLQSIDQYLTISHSNLVAVCICASNSQVSMTNSNLTSVGSHAWNVFLNASQAIFSNDNFTASPGGVQCCPTQPETNAINIFNSDTTIQNSVFYSSETVVPAAICINSGNNTITNNKFITEYVDPFTTQTGVGSSIITFGGNNQVSNNEFITLTGGAQSAYVKLGDSAQQAGNVYLYNVAFSETGLKAGTVWSVSVDGKNYVSNSSTINVLLSKGNYSYTATSSGFGSMSGSVDVSGAASVPVSFTPLPKFSLTFTETGLPHLTNWTVSLGNMTETTSGTSMTFYNLSEGSYTYTTGVFSKYYSPVSGSGTVSLTRNTTVSVPFSGVNYTLMFAETGLNTNSNWSVVINGEVYYSHGSDYINVTMPIGTTVTYVINNETGFVQSLKSGDFLVSSNSTVKVQFSRPGISPAVTYGAVAASVVAGFVVGGALVTFLPKLRKKKLS